jgi:hypothetical protein
MNEFNRTELRLILEGLDIVRERMRENINVDLGGEEYNGLVRLQDRIIDALESTFY